MKLILASILIFASACAKPNETAKPLVFSAEPQFLVAGQSNGVSPAQEHVAYWSKTGLTEVTDVYGSGELRIPTVQNPVNSSIAWIYLGDMIQTKVSFTNIARGNQSTRRWVNEHFETLMRPALTAKAFDAVLWIQGESDIGEHFAEAETYENMRTIINKSREVRPGLVWFVALNSQKTVPQDNSVRRAQARIIAEGYALQGPDTDSMRSNAEYMEDSFGEFVGTGLRQHAALWFEVLKPYLKGSN